MAKRTSSPDQRFELSSVQRQAVESVGTPVLIFAGAGSGKTRVLTHKIAYLIQAKHYKPENVLAVTFTNKAAEEMKSRVQKLLGLKSLGVLIGTFHSICARILRNEISRFGFSPNFVIYDREDQVQLIKSVLQDLNLSKDHVTPTAVQGRLSFLKSKMTALEGLAESAESPFDEAIVEIFPAYQKALKKNDALDFDDLLLFPIKLFEDFPRLLNKYQNQFQYLLVDEYQDTNRPQFLFVKMLAQHHRQISVVGDDDQSIYGWRGADIANILEFETTFPDCKVYKLEQNYRSTQTVLSAASAVVSRNTYRSPKTLLSVGEKGEQIGLMETFDEQEEAEGVIELMEKEILQNKRMFKDFVILYRTNAQSRAFEEALVRRGIAYTIVGGISFYKRKEVKDLLAYFRLIVNPLDSVSLKRVINFPPKGIGAKTIERCEEYGEKMGISLLEVLRDPEKVGIKGKQAEGLKEFHHLIRKYQSLKDKFSASELVSVLMDELGLVGFYKDQATAEAKERLDNVQELLQSIHDFCERKEGAGIQEFLEEVSLLTDIDTWEVKASQVTLMTLHSAKGLEFPVVFIVGLEEGLFPIASAMDNIQDLEEERRLFYVGLTRAQKEVYLHYATNRRRASGNIGFGIPSRFIHDIPEEFIDRITFQSAVIKQTIKEKGSDTFTYKQVRTVTAFNDLVQGDKVEHKLFGKGEVISVDGTGEHQKISVVFQGNVVKKLIARYANLRKL